MDLMKYREELLSNTEFLELSNDPVVQEIDDKLRKIYETRVMPLITCEDLSEEDFSTEWLAISEELRTTMEEGKMRAPRYYELLEPLIGNSLDMISID